MWRHLLSVGILMVFFQLRVKTIKPVIVGVLQNRPQQGAMQNVLAQLPVQDQAALQKVSPVILERTPAGLLPPDRSRERHGAGADGGCRQDSLMGPVFRLAGCRGNQTEARGPAGEPL